MKSEPMAPEPADRQAFAALVREHHRSLLVYARALARQDATAADLVQDALVAAWRNLGRFDVTRDFGAWLRGIIRNKWREYLRRHAREVDIDESTLETWESYFSQWDAHRDDGHADMLEALEGCLQHLPGKLHDVVRRYYYQHQPGDAIAHTLCCDGATIRKRLERARHTLRACLERKLQTPNQP